MKNKKTKKIKVYWNGQPLRDIYPHATKFQVFRYKVGRLFVKTVKIVALGICIFLVLFVVFKMGQMVYPNTVYADKLVVVDGKFPVLERIAQCESHYSHFCTIELAKAGLCAKSEVGQVLVKANDNKTIDVGKYQVNVYYWGKEATQQELNLFDEKDNEKMATWIYKNHGTGDWSSSKKCWDK